MKRPKDTTHKVGGYRIRLTACLRCVNGYRRNEKCRDCAGKSYHIIYR